MRTAGTYTSGGIWYRAPVTVLALLASDFVLSYRGRRTQRHHLMTPPTAHIRDSFAAAVDALGLPADVNDSLDSLYLPVAHWLMKDTSNRPAPYVLGVNGAQGSGKSTFCHLLAALLRTGFERSVLVVSIDDLYHLRETRLDLADQIHPLCMFRGVPGTHDIALGDELFDTLASAKAQQRVWVPRFDKSIDDRAAQIRLDRMDRSTRHHLVRRLVRWLIHATPMDRPTQRPRKNG